MFWRSIWFTFAVSFVSSYSFCRASDCSFERGCYWAIGIACCTLSIHRFVFTSNGKGI